jgi:hypothetical protein
MNCCSPSSKTRSFFTTSRWGAHACLWPNLKPWPKQQKGRSHLSPANKWLILAEFFGAAGPVEELVTSAPAVGSVTCRWWSGCWRDGKPGGRLILPDVAATYVDWRNEQKKICRTGASACDTATTSSPVLPPSSTTPARVGQSDGRGYCIGNEGGVTKMKNTRDK